MTGLRYELRFRPAALRQLRKPCSAAKQDGTSGRRLAICVLHHREVAETSGSVRYSRRNQKAIIAGPPVVKAEAPFPEPVVDQQITLRNPMIKEGLMLALGIMGGIAIESFTRRLRQ